MILKDIYARNFRRFKEITLDFSPGVNLFSGNNGEGKTNLLEAIYLLGISRSFRTSKDTDLINWDERFFLLTADVIRDDIQTRIELSFSPPQKMAKVNEKKLPRMIDLIGHLRVVLFSPEDIYLIKAEPVLRRQFINILISQINHKYLHGLQSYQHILKQRNEILMRLRETSSPSLKRELDVWSEQLFELGVYLTKTRAKTIEEINPLLQGIYSRIAPERVEIKYSASLKSNLRSELEGIESEEIRRGLTLIGPHRDDLIFYLNGVNARAYSSQGQQRSIAVCLRLAEVEYIYNQLQDYPVLLLDDITSELDMPRREYLFKTIKGKGVVQTFITATSIEGFDLAGADVAFFKFENGRVKRSYEGTKD